MVNDHADTTGRPGMALIPVMPGLDWTEIRAAAVRCARHGWPVLEGTYQLAQHGGWLGKPGAVGLEPVADLWPTATTTDPDATMARWSRRPYSVLLACGHAVNAVEVPFAHGQRALSLLASGERGPVAATPYGSSLFFVHASDEPVHPELASPARAHLHGAGSWLPLPPTACEGVPYRWRVAPSATEWKLPTSADVQRVLVRTLE
jgi:hypothetical protein